MNKHFSKFLILLTISSIVITGCARDMGSNVYTSSSVTGKVIEGKIVSARPVMIKDSDKLDNNVLGMIGGGILGGLGGNLLGKGKGNAIATVGGALAGAAAGAVVQDKLGTSKGMEYVVRIDPQYVNEIPTNIQKNNVTLGNQSVDSEVKGATSVSTTKTDLISIVQGADTVYTTGQKVLIMYNNDRPRITGTL